MTYEDFMAAWKQSQDATPRVRQPRFSIESVEISGKAREEYAELRLETTVKLLTDGQMKVPLGLVGAILQGEPQFGGLDSAPSPAKEAGGAPSREGGEPSHVEFLDYDSHQGGFVAHLGGKAGEKHTVTLVLLVPLVHDGIETSLALNCPRALTSRLALDIDAPVAQATVSSGAILSREAVAGGTRLTATGLAGQFRLTWGTAEVETAELTTVLSATGAISASIDGRSVRTDARLTVRSYGGSFDRFRVRLPKGATLIQETGADAESEPSYEITTERASTSTEGESDSATGQVVVVQLKEKQQGPVSVDLATEQLLDAQDADLAIELGGYEVLGAVRQFGDVALRVAGDWQLRWDTGRYVRQVDASELAAGLQQPGVSAAFQYDRQPWSLGIQVAARRFRIQVTPAYELDCLPDEARLKVHLTYQILGARAFEFQVDLAGWEMAADAVESGGLVDRDQIKLTREGQLILPLMQASSRRAEVSFVVRRDLPRDTSRLNLPLPEPVAESIVTGDLVVRTAPGVELMADMLQTGLTPTPVTSSPDDIGEEDVNQLRYRMFLPGAVFAADRLSRTREISTSIETRIALQNTHARVAQRLTYHVQFEPIAELAFDIPAGVSLDEEVMEVALLPLDGQQPDAPERQETLLRPVAVSESESTENAPRSVRMALPRPRLGHFVVEFRYPVQRPSARPRNGSWNLPLVKPLDGEVTRSLAIVETPPEFEALLDELTDTTWETTASPTSDADGGEGNQFIARQAEPALPLSIRDVELDIPTTTIIDRTWLQTWLNGNTRQERAAFRFRSDASQVTIELPPESAANEVEVLLDGRPANVVAREEGRITVRLNSLQPSRDRDAENLSTTPPRTLELRFRRTSNDRLVTGRRLTPPLWAGVSSLTEVYWQIVLPGDLHIIQSPDQMAAASQWQWLGSFWGRRPTHSQAELEAWVGASPQVAPSAAQSEYLFSGLGPVSSIEIVTAPRWLVVLAGSGGVLALALAWLYLPIDRRAWVVAIVAVVLAMLAVSFPTPAMLLAQASLLGILLAALAFVIARFTRRPQQWSLPVSGGSTHRQLTPRAESAVLSPLPTAGASTAPTASVHVGESE
jgi:hypothetical protein